MTVLFLVPVFTSAIFRYLRMQLESDSSLLRSKSELKPCITAQQKTKRDNKDRLSGINFASRGHRFDPGHVHQIFL